MNNNICKYKLVLLFILTKFRCDLYNETIAYQSILQFFSTKKKKKKTNFTSNKILKYLKFIFIHNP